MKELLLKTKIKDAQLKRLISQVTSPGPEEVRKGHYR
jgi:hypothetical protein